MKRKVSLILALSVVLIGLTAQQARRGAGAPLPGSLTVGGVPYTFPADDGEALEFLQSDGSGTLDWAASGGTDISGTPANNQLGVWTDADTLEGDADLTWDDTNLYIKAAVPLLFEGATANSYETSIAVTDPTADRTITIPDSSGTLFFSGGTDLSVADGGTGASSLTDGGVLLGSGTGAITATAVLGDGEILIGDASGDPATLDIGSSTSITVLGTVATGTWEATDVGAAHGGTGASSLTDGGVLLGSGTGAITPMSVLADSEFIVGDGSGDPVAESGATLRTSIGVGTGDSPQFTALTLTAATVAILEGATADGYETSIVVTDPTADRTITLQNASGTVAFTSDITSGAIDISGTPANNQLAVWTDADTLEGDSDLTWDGTSFHVNGNTGWGSAPVGWIKHNIGSTFTSSGGSNTLDGIAMSSNLTGASGDTVRLGGVRFANQITTQTATESIAEIFQLELVEPVITDNLTGDITVAQTLKITSAPTEGEDNYALNVISGAVRIGAAGTNDGHVHILSPSTGISALVLEMPASATANSLLMQYSGSNRGGWYTDATNNYITMSTADLGSDNPGPRIILGYNNNSGTDSAGHIRTTDKGGTDYHLWVDDTGDWRIGTTAPIGSQDTSGTVVGTMSSPEYIKNILHVYPNIPGDLAYEKFQQVINTPIKDFTFKDGRYNGDIFTGLAIPSGENPWYGQDPVVTDLGTDIAPIGTAKSLNELNMAGYFILSFKVLNKEIEALKNEIETLKRRGRSGLDVAGIQ